MRASGQKFITVLILVVMLITMMPTAMMIALADAVDGNPEITERFVDPSFIGAVYDIIGKEPGDLIFEDDVKAIEALDVSGKGISSLSGIEYFYGLIELDCSDNALETLYIGLKPNLQVLDCSANRLEELDLSGLTILRGLNCSDNKLCSLDLRAQSDLVVLLCPDNELAELNIEGLSGLTGLVCSANKLTELDIGASSALETLICSDNMLSVLDVSGFSALKALVCSGNKLTELNVSGLVAMEALDCAGNRLRTLDVSGLVGLTELHCSDNDLSALILGDLPELKYLSCANNDLTELNVSGLSALEALFLARNKLESIDLGGLGGLLDLDCSDNLLKGLNLSGLSGLRYMNAAYNYIDPSALIYDFDIEGEGLELIWIALPQRNDLEDGREVTDQLVDASFAAAVRIALGKEANAPIFDKEVAALGQLIVNDKGISSLEGIELFSGLFNLECADNNLTALDISALKELINLDCSGNKLTGLDVSGSRNLKYLDCSENELAELNIRDMSALAYLNCSFNLLDRLDLGSMPELTSVNCSRNKLEDLDISGLPGLGYLKCSYNYIEDESRVTGALPENFFFSPQLSDTLPQDAPKFKPSVSYAANGDIDYTVSIYPMAGLEYSFDGEVFSAINAMEGVRPGETVSAYIRYAFVPCDGVKPNYAASDATRTDIVLPLFTVKTPKIMTGGQSLLDVLGRTYTGGVNVSLSTDTGAAAIYYTTDGSVPTKASKLYKGLFTLSATATIKAVAIRDGMIDSDILSVKLSRQTGSFSLDAKESITVMPSNSSAVSDTINDPSYERDLIVEIVSGGSRVIVAPKDITINKQQYVVKLPSKVAQGGSVNIYMAGLPGLLDRLELARYVNDTGKDINGTFHFIQEAHPVTRARQQHITGLSCEKIGEVLFNEFGLGAEYIAKIMAGEAFGPSDTARMLRGAGFEAAQIAGAMKEAYRLSAARAVEVLYDLGFDAIASADAVTFVYGAGENEALDCLLSAGYTAADIALACGKYFGLSDADAARQLDRLGVALTVMADALTDVYGMDPSRIALVFAGILGYSAGDILDVSLGHMGLDPVVAVRYLYIAGFGIDEYIDTLLAYMPGAPPRERAYALAAYAAMSEPMYENNFVEAVKVLAEALPGGDKASITIADIANFAKETPFIGDFVDLFIELFTAESVADACYNLLDFGASALADMLSGSDWFELGGAVVGTVVLLLDGLGVQSDLIFTALNFAGDYLDMCAKSLYETFLVPADYLMKWIFKGDFEYKDMYRVITDTIHVGLGLLLDAYKVVGEFCDDMFYLLRDLGDQLSYIPFIGDIISYAAYIFVAAKFPLYVWGEVYGAIFDLTGEQFVDYLKTAFNTTINGLIWLFGKAKYAADEVMRMFLGVTKYAAQEIAAAFKYVYGWTLEKVAGLLTNIGYALDAIITAAKQVFNIVSEAAVKAFQTILVGLGHAVSAVANALSSAFNAVINAIASAAKAVGNFFKNLFRL